ncbi:MAG: ribonuclease domain-containing protein [Oscillospiraceae bacterium]
MNKMFGRVLSVLLTGVLLILCGCNRQVSDSALSSQSSTLQTHAITTTTTTTAESTTITTTTQTTTVETTVDTETTQSLHIARDGSYTTKEDVSLYLYTYGELPQNFITKKEAQALGWEGGSLEPYAPGCCIGGSYFGNYEGLLPEESGRSYYECDIDTLGKSSRGAKRIVYSNDGLIYYTADHYEHFTLLYGEPEE